MDGTEEASPGRHDLISRRRMLSIHSYGNQRQLCSHQRVLHTWSIILVFEFDYFVWLKKPCIQHPRHYVEYQRQ